MNSPDTGDELKIRYTSVVRRGLRLLVDLVEAGTDENKPPIETQVARLTPTQRREVERAVAWVDQESPRKETP